MLYHAYVFAQAAKISALLVCTVMSLSWGWGGGRGEGGEGRQSANRDQIGFFFFFFSDSILFFGQYILFTPSQFGRYYVLLFQTMNMPKIN